MFLELRGGKGSKFFPNLQVLSRISFACANNIIRLWLSYGIDDGLHLSGVEGARGSVVAE